MGSLKTFNLEKRIREALNEDILSGDITSEPVFPENHKSSAVLIAKEPGIITGLNVARRVCKTVDPELTFKTLIRDGAKVKTGSRIVRMKGKTVSILKAERTMLNFLQHLSGVASVTAAFVAAVKGTGAKILDTRKTTPLWRDLEKAAVKAGGGSNHRMGLYDAVLIKDNHITAAGGITRAVEKIRAAHKGTRVFIEVEVKNLREVREAAALKVNRILLDNMTPAQMIQSVKWLRDQKKRLPQTEASGGVSLSNVLRIARTGVDYISVGALTHSAPNLDISLLIDS